MPQTLLKFLSAVIVVLGFEGIASAQAAESLGDIVEDAALSIDPAAISVSGVSSGGFMANQFHLAHSAKIMGAGIVAAGPYHCAGTPSFSCNYSTFSFFMPHDTCQASYVCTALAREETFFGFYLGPPDAGHSLQSAEDEAQAGRIDALGNLKDDRVWLFSGGQDRLVPRDVMDQLQAFYATLFARPEIANPADAIDYQKLDQAEHAMVVSIPGPPEANTCGDYGPPFINDCDYPAAGGLLDFICRLDAANAQPPGPDDWDRDGLVQFDQTPFLQEIDESASMHNRGHVYLPQRCRNGETCPLHVAFHGCRQSEEAVDEACGASDDCPALHFFRDAGYNPWAERHGIVVLYPQVTEWGGDFDTSRNPRGCWDWWGYSGDDYFRKSAPQIRAVNAMIDCLTGAGNCGD